MVNPFGESDTAFAWKERFKQQEFQTQTLQKRVSELKFEFDQLTEMYNQQMQVYEATKEELSKTRQELLAMARVAADRKESLDELERTLETTAVTRLKDENEKLRMTIDNLQSELTRSGGAPEVSAGLSTSLTPLMLREFDPENARYTSAFMDLVESVIKEGDTFQKIIGILIKHGGRGPKDKLGEVIGHNELSLALEMLEEEKILKVIDNSIMLTTSEDTGTKRLNWDELTLEDVFAEMKGIFENQTEDQVIKGLDSFRDTLQEREIPVAKIFFEIRKLSEAFSKGRITRKEALKQIDDWWGRVQGA
ncbi:MAG: hypothetical protein ACXAD7_21670 [Candidatus Kariarchaeaceae archaeon]|jgi:hypothetical protein